jgi:hypothetical protein
MATAALGGPETGGAYLRRAFFVMDPAGIVVVVLDFISCGLEAVSDIHVNLISSDRALLLLEI